MRKMGWREGEGLGKNKEGSVEPIMVDFKTDRKGESWSPAQSCLWLLSCLHRPLGAGGFVWGLPQHMEQVLGFCPGLPRPGVSPKLCPRGKAVVALESGWSRSRVEDGVVGTVLLQRGEDRAEGPKAELCH